MGNSCWFDSVNFSLLYPISSRNLFMNYIDHHVKKLSKIQSSKEEKNIKNMISILFK
jgi:hypothetical protein